MGDEHLLKMFFIAHFRIFNKSYWKLVKITKKSVIFCAKQKHNKNIVNRNGNFLITHLCE